MVNQIRELLDQNADIRASRQKGWNALHGIALTNRIDIAELLLNKAEENGIDDYINTQTIDGGWSAVSIAASQENLKMVEYLTSRKADVIKGNTDSRTPLHMAVYADSTSIADVLIARAEEQGMKSNDYINLGRSAGDHATSKSMDDFLKSKSDPDKHSSSSTVVRSGNLRRQLSSEIAKFVSGRDVDDTTFRDLLNQEGDVGVAIKGRDYLHKIARTNRTDIAQLLLNKAKEQNIKDYINACDDLTDKTPIMYAVAAGEIGMVKFLASNGASVLKANNNGISSLSQYPLSSAVAGNRIDIAEVLLGKGKSEGLNYTDYIRHVNTDPKSFPRTSEMSKFLKEKIDYEKQEGTLAQKREAKIAGGEKLIQKILRLRQGEDVHSDINLLLMQGVDVTIKNENGQNALHLLAHTNLEGFADMLIANAKSQNVKDYKKLQDNYGKTAETYAKETGQLEGMIRLLTPPKENLEDQEGKKGNRKKFSKKGRRNE